MIASPLLQNIYFINLDHSKQRYKNVTENMNKYGLKYQRFEAIYGRDLSTEYIDEHVHPLCQTLTCSKGFIGASFSHISLWNKISQDHSFESWYLILEDDVWFEDETFEKMHVVEQFVKTLDPRDPIIINVSPFNVFEPNAPQIVPAQYLSGLSAYLINTSAARLLADYYKENQLRYIIDADASLVPGLHKYSTSQQVIRTSFNIKDAINKDVNYSLPLFQTLITLLPENFSEKINFLINSSTIHPFMKFTIPNGYVILFVLFMVCTIIKSKWLMIYIIIEVLLVHTQNYLV